MQTHDSQRLNSLSMPYGQSTPYRILILKADRLCSATLRQIAFAVFPSAEIAERHLIAEARQWLSGHPIDLLLAGSSLLDGDTSGFLASSTGDRPYRVLIVTGSRQPHVLKRLRALSISGIFDSFAETASSLAVAVRKVAEGGAYWSSTILRCIEAVPTKAHLSAGGLSLTEQIVLSVAGDGSDDKEASSRLGLTPAAVQSIRRSLHRKLRVQQRGDLIRRAIQLGYVQFTPDGVDRPGFEQLLVEWKTWRRQRNS